MRHALTLAQVSNYRASQTLDEYLKAQGVMGIADVDTRAITRRLRQDGCLNGVITTDASLSDEELIAKTRVRSSIPIMLGCLVRNSNLIACPGIASSALTLMFIAHDRDADCDRGRRYPCAQPSCFRSKCDDCAPRSVLATMYWWIQ